MSTTTATETLIAYHTQGHLPESPELRRWQLRLEAQRRFDEVGLPRGLRVVG